MHEFFHTVGYGARKVEERRSVYLINSSTKEEYTFQDWWIQYENLILSGREPDLISKYASNYSAQLDLETIINSPDKFELAIAEQICETFAAYMLGIVPNDDDWVYFREENFGNSVARYRYV